MHSPGCYRGTRCSRCSIESPKIKRIFRSSTSAAMLAVLLLALALPAARAAAPVSGAECAWDGTTQRCDVSPLYVMAATVAPAPGDKLAASLVKSAAADAACSLIVTEAECEARSPDLKCEWLGSFFPKCRLRHGALVEAAYPFAACPGSNAEKQLPCTLFTDGAKCKAGHGGQCGWIPPTDLELSVDPAAPGVCAHKDFLALDLNERDQFLLQYQEHEPQAWGDCPAAQVRS
ncbi:MAG: hypothetical protein J3K34DRAFT_177004 [Monoraphidium minutum]|nr:MAG: hypothetical protein J3K34DRAFT_177004 [Monoraphidium minutum]